jgi:flagellar hook-length control protein FliK
MDDLKAGAVKEGIAAGSVNFSGAPAPGSKLADTMPIALSVVGQSTSFAPVTASSLVPQVAAPIIAACHAPASVATSTYPPAAPVVRTLEIQLVPENLGSVTVKMKLTDNVLAVQVAADHQGTLRLLTESKDALAQSLQSSGYKLDSMTLQSASGQGGTDAGQATPGQQHRFEPQSSPQGSSLGSSQQGESRARDQWQSGKGREGVSGEASDGYSQDNDRDRRASFIYV